MKRTFRLLLKDLALIVLTAVPVVLLVGHLTGGSVLCGVEPAVIRSDNPTDALPESIVESPGAVHSTKRREISPEFVEAYRSGELSPTSFQEGGSPL